MRTANDGRMRWVSLGVLAGMMLGSGRARADFTFGEPVNLGPTLNTSSSESYPTLSADGLELYFNSNNRPGGLGYEDIWVSTRATVNDAWPEPTNLGPHVNSSGYDGAPCLSADGLSLYFSSLRSGGHGNSDIWVTRRTTRSDAWGVAENLAPPVNTWDDEGSPTVSSDGLELFFSELEPLRPGGQGGSDLWMTRRSSLSGSWEPPINLGPTTNSSSQDRQPSISADGLILLFMSERPGGYGRKDIWLTRRPTTGASWGIPVNLGPSVNTSGHDKTARLSVDGTMLYFSSMRPGRYGGFDLWQARVLPVVDFTGDFRVDIEDLVLLIEHWGQNEPAYDMGPTPWGDGVIDAADLEVLMSYWGQELDDPNLLAHWKFDEMEGNIAYDSAGDHDATVIGEALWRSEDGQVDGALQLDGATSIDAGRVLNSSDHPFSVFVWVKGGTPGQVVLSQAGGKDCLMVDASEGTLATDVGPLASRNPVPPLVSDAVIADDTWHRIGLVWDGISRALYVDAVLVAEDAQDSLTGYVGDLNIGCGKDMTPGTFWEGLIDDVRIYNRAVRP